MFKYQKPQTSKDDKKRKQEDTKKEDKSSKRKKFHDGEEKKENVKANKTQEVMNSLISNNKNDVNIEEKYSKMVKSLPPIIKGDPKLKKFLSINIGKFVSKITGEEIGKNITAMLVDIPFITMEEINDYL